MKKKKTSVSKPLENKKEKVITTEKVIFDKIEENKTTAVEEESKITPTERVDTNLPFLVHATSKQLKFNTNNYNFTQETYTALQRIVTLMAKNPNATFKIIGYTDNIGSEKNNKTLSKARANAIRNYMVDSGFLRENIQTIGLGESKPIDTNLTKEGRENNRRIEIIVVNEGNIDLTSENPVLKNALLFKAPEKSFSSPIYILSQQIKFNAGSSNLSQAALSVLKKILTEIVKTPKNIYKIIGHTDSSGSYNSNRRLSIERAKAIKNYLTSNGVLEENIQACGLGESKPTNSNLQRSRKNNNRVEIFEVE